MVEVLRDRWPVVNRVQQRAASQGTELAGARWCLIINIRAAPGCFVQCLEIRGDTLRNAVSNRC